MRRKPWYTQYYIYGINIGTAIYIGSTNNYKRRMSQHLKELEENTHNNNDLQHQFNLHNGEFSSIILKQFETCAKSKVFRLEQLYINKHSNANEAVASKNISYSWKWFFIDVFDYLEIEMKFIEKHYLKIGAGVLLIVLIVGFGMSFEQAQEWVYKFWNFINF